MERNIFRRFGIILGKLEKCNVDIGVFYRMDLQTGFELDLGHDGSSCPAGGRGQQPNSAADNGPVPMDDDEWQDMEPMDHPPHLKPPSGSDYLTIVDVSGIHFVTVNFCTCPGSPPEYVQLLRCHLFPATLKTMRTAFTFRVLDDFIRDNLECGTSAMNYYSKLRRVTSNVFPHLIPVCR